MISWNFPSNNYGQSDGLNHPGIETFAGRPLWYLAREISQNSCDAADSASGRPVEVEFKLLEPAIGKFPDIGEFLKILKACKSYWKQNKKANNFFTNGIRVGSEPTLRLLKISDYNTTGLAGPHNLSESDWFRLTKSVGASEKEGGGIGSFGIGKHAPFACSDLRTVFYATKDKSGQFAFQGVSKLVTHKRGAGETTQGTGFFGHKQKNTPVVLPKDVDSIFRRTRIGADVFIAGFHPYPDWEHEIAKSILENFFVAIHEARLIVRIGDLTLNSTSLPELINTYQEEDPEFMATAYWDALQDTAHVHVFVEENFEELGRIELRIVKNKKFKKRIAMVRGGMKIYDKGHFQTPMRFAGVFTARGVELNELLRSLEPPSHDDWQFDRHEDPAYARLILRKLNKWINDKVSSMATVDDVKELDVDELSKFLPDDLDEMPPQAESEPEGSPAEPKSELDIQIRKPKGFKVPEKAQGRASGEGEDEGISGIREHGEDGVISKGDGEREGVDDSTGDSGNDKTKPSKKGTKPTHRTRVGLKGVRVFCTDPKSVRYRVLFAPEFTGLGVARVFIVGEEHDDIAPIKEIWLAGATEAMLPSATGEVGPLDFEINTQLSFDLVLSEPLHCALGVVAYAN